MGARDLLADLAGAGLSVTAEGDRLVIRPASKLTEHMRHALREAKPELLVLLSAPSPIRNCAACAYRLKGGTCAEPAPAGLEPPPGTQPGTDWFGIRWAPDGHATHCPAFDSLD